MAEVYFYHLEQRPLEQVLPTLVAKSVERGWRAVIQATTPERVDALDTLLWTFDEASFLAHGTAKDGHPELQAVFLTTDDGNPNGAAVRFFVDGADVADLSGYARAVHLFDGHDPDAVARARTQWKTARAAGHTIVYWQQDDQGRWVKKG